MFHYCHTGTRWRQCCWFKDSDLGPETVGVIPAQAGIQTFPAFLDPGLRRGNEALSGTFLKATVLHSDVQWVDQALGDQTCTKLTIARARRNNRSILAEAKGARVEGGPVDEP
jgi:hypothetical protein